MLCDCLNYFCELDLGSESPTMVDEGLIGAIPTVHCRTGWGGWECVERGDEEQKGGDDGRIKRERRDKSSRGVHRVAERFGRLTLNTSAAHS